MAVGRRPKLTMPILVRMNIFCIKMTQTYYLFKVQDDQKNFDRPTFGWSVAMDLTTLARHIGPLLHEMAVFS